MRALTPFDAIDGQFLRGGIRRIPAAISSVSARDARIDLFRGFALLAIFVDHIPSSVLRLATPHAFAVADAAEIFFFLSGFVSAMTYGRTLEQAGMIAATARVWRRAWTLYAAQILLLVFFVGEISLGVLRTGQISYHSYFRTDDFISQPELAILHALTLNFQPLYLDILPCYVVFLLAFPLVLAAFRQSVWLALVPSFLLYLGVQCFGWTPLTFPRGEGWFLNPLAWQFLFVLGALFGSGRATAMSGFLSSRLLLAATILLALPVALIQEWDTLHGLWPHLPALFTLDLPADKSSLAPLRLVSFFAVAILARRMLPARSRFLQSPVARSLACCGRHSLNVFCLGILLSVLGRVVLEQFGQSMLDQIAVTSAGVATLVAFAWANDWLSASFRRWRAPTARGPGFYP